MLTRYSSYRPSVDLAIETKEQGIPNANPFMPIVVVGTAVVAALMVLLLLTQSQLSQISFEISALETELANLERQQDKLLVAHAEAYRLEEIERYATEELGMVHPNPDLIRTIYIDTAERSREEPN